MKTTLLYTIVLFLIIIGFVVWLIYMQVEEYKLQDDPKLRELKEKFYPFFDKKDFTGNLEPLNKQNLLNKISLYKGDKSYTINKQKVFLCLKDENGNYYPDMALIYVFLHECAHSVCSEIGHTPLFNEIFDELLLEAAKSGLYDPKYQMIQNYCNYND